MTSSKKLISCKSMVVVPIFQNFLEKFKLIVPPKTNKLHYDQQIWLLSKKITIHKIMFPLNCKSENLQKKSKKSEKKTDNISAYQLNLVTLSNKIKFVWEFRECLTSNLVKRNIVVQHTKTWTLYLDKIQQ